ncbi:hypothetical protein FCV25MIE_16828 [Fagus crenata]
MDYETTTTDMVAEKMEMKVELSIWTYVCRSDELKKREICGFGSTTSLGLWLLAPESMVIGHGHKLDPPLKALHVIRCSNKHGMFLEIPEFHSGSHQGVIRIPEGAERQGWVHFSKLCKEFMAPPVVPQRNIPIGRDMER